jgi:putative tricarboxylic transport membrane protein
VKVLMLLCVFAWAGGAAASEPAWKPTRAIELIVGVSPGGGIDRTARVVQKILQDRHLVDVPVNVVNKPGGGGTVAQAYFNQRPGDAHVYEITSTSLLTNHITGKSTLGHRDFTPVAMLYDEYIGFAVKGDSPIRTGRELLQALKDAPDSLPIGIASAAGNTNHIAAALAAKAAGADVRKLKIVVFSSGGESMTALLGGHVALVVTPSANLIPHIETGRMRALAVASPSRLGGRLSAVPTWKEQGIDTVVANWRPLVGPKGWSAAQTAYWEGVYAKLTASEEWKAEVERIGGVNHYMGSRELAAYLEQQYQLFRNVLVEAALAR